MQISTAILEELRARLRLYTAAVDFLLGGAVSPEVSRACTGLENCTFNRLAETHSDLQRAAAEPKGGR